MTVKGAEVRLRKYREIAFVFAEIQWIIKYTIQKIMSIFSQYIFSQPINVFIENAAVRDSWFNLKQMQLVQGQATFYAINHTHRNF